MWHIGAMNFRYEISLRIWQDVYTRNELSLRLGMEHEMGRAPEMPTEEGMAFWRRRLVDAKSKEKDIEEALGEVVTMLERQSVLLFSLARGNGAVELFIALFGDGNIMHRLCPKAMMRLGQLGVELCFDVSSTQSSESE
jgi:hypothetical protein